MTIGTEIKEVFSEFGAKVEIVRTAGNVKGEYLKTKSNAQVTKPFIREFFIEAEAPYDTKIVGGDVIYVPTTGLYYLVMNKSPDMFENAVYRWTLVLYKVNVFGSLIRLTTRRNPQTYQEETIETVITSSFYGLLTNAEHGAELNQKAPIALQEIDTMELYFPSSYLAKPLDRLKLSSTEWYELQVVKRRRFDGVDICRVEEDFRAVTTTSTTSTTSTTTSSVSTTSTQSTTSTVP